VRNVIVIIKDTYTAVAAAAAADAVV